MSLIRKISSKLTTKSMFPNRNNDGYVDFFLHIPKTGGSCVRTVMAQNYDLDEIRTFNGPPVDYENFRKGDNSITKRTRLVYGHVPSGVENHAGRPVRKRVTLIREPISRLISDYLFSLTDEGGYNGIVMKNNMSFIEFVSEGTKGALVNNQSKWLAGVHPDIEAEQVSDHTLQELAFRSVEKFDLIGVNEFLPETMIFMAKTLGWKPPIFKSVNMSMLSKRFLQTLSEDTVAKIRDINKIDCLIYEYAKDKFKKKMEAAGPYFWKSLEEVIRENSRVDGNADQMDKSKTFVLGRDSFKQTSFEHMPYTKKFLETEF